MPSMDAALTFLLVGGGAVYLAACLAAFRGLLAGPRDVSDRTPRVSVIVAARNERENIGALLGDLLAQEYPADRMEIVAVDDCSEDDTGTIIAAHAARDSRLRLAGTRESRSPYSYKKRAVHEGILSSNGEIILTVDADCRISPGWIRGMVGRFADGVDLVAGTVIVEGAGGGGRLEALEFAGIQAMAAGLMNAGFPVTCNGANLAYRRTAFERVGGFEGIGRVVSGDDDLLMQKITRNGAARAVFLTGPETAVRVRSAESLRAFLFKRIRWASKIGAYPSKSAVGLLSIIFLFFAAIPVAAAALLLGHPIGMPLIAGLGMKVAGDLILTGYALHREDRIGLLCLFFPAEALHVPYILGVTLCGMFGTFEWRGRRTGAFHERVTEGTNP